MQKKTDSNAAVPRVRCEAIRRRVVASRMRSGRRLMPHFMCLHEPLD